VCAVAAQRLADSADTESAEGLAQLLADSSLQLLRRAPDWTASTGDCTFFREAGIVAFRRRRVSSSRVIVARRRRRRASSPSGLRGARRSSSSSGRRRRAIEVPSQHVSRFAFRVSRSLCFPLATDAKQLHARAFAAARCRTSTDRHLAAAAAALLR